MKKYLIILILFTSCGNNMETASPANVDNITIDSLNIGIDSLADMLSSINIEAASYIKKVENKIEKLENDKKELQERTNDASIVYVEKRNDDKRIADLNKQILLYKNEIASLKSQLRIKKNEEYVVSKKNIEQQEPEVKKPDENSLVVELNKKIRGNGNINTENVNVYLIPFSKKAKKAIVRYQEACDLSQINSFGGVVALVYNDQYFFNDVKPGKYIIKVCYYYGGFAVIEKSEDRMIVKLNVSETQ